MGSSYSHKFQSTLRFKPVLINGSSRQIAIELVNQWRRGTSHNVSTLVHIQIVWHCTWLMILLLILIYNEAKRYANITCIFKPFGYSDRKTWVIKPIYMVSFPTEKKTSPFVIRKHLHKKQLNKAAPSLRFRQLHIILTYNEASAR